MKIKRMTRQLRNKKLNLTLAPVAMAVAVALMTVPSAQSQIPSKGDLDIYSSGSANKNPTLMLMIEGSTFTHNADSIKEGLLDLRIVEFSNSNTTPSYKRTGYNTTQSGEYFPTRLTRMKDAIFYLMDTPGLLPDNYQVGIGRYSSSTLSHKNIGDGITGSVNVPARALGPASESNKKSSQRYKIKQFVAEMCDYNRLCTGEAPMASAYAEAGAYMMGTKTAKLSKEAPDGSNVQPYVRVLRYKTGSSSDRRTEWQYCPPEYRNLKRYESSEGEVKARLECDEADWVNVSSESVADGDWAKKSGKYSDGTRYSSETVDPGEYEALNSKQKKYDLVWWDTTTAGDLAGRDAPYGVHMGLWETVGTGDGGQRMSPVTQQLTTYDFRRDSFNNFGPTETEKNGKSGAWGYLYDDTLTPEVRLEPILRHRAIRQKYVGYNNKDSSDSLTPTRIWQYCKYSDAQLVNYIYSSYRLMCNDSDWIDIAVYDSSGYVSKSLTEKRMTDLGINLKWNDGYFPWITRGGRPHGIVGRHTESNRQFTLDPLVNPYDGWQYWYDADLTRKQYPPLPPTLNFSFSSSGIRNSPPEVRNPQQYTYQQPTYSQCSGAVQYDTSGQVVSEKSVENGIIFLTAGWPRSAIAKPLNEMNMSLTPAPKNEPEKLMTKATCEASGLDASGPINNHWDCMGEYSRYLRQAKVNGKEYKNPANMPIKTGVVMFTANDEQMNTNTLINGLPKYNCEAASQDSQKSACKLGQYGEGYGEGGFFQATSEDPNQSVKELAQAIITMAKNLGGDSGMVPTSMPIVPSNPLQPGKLFNHGYLPLVQPQSVSSQAQWPGNLRKYSVAADGNSFKDSKGNNPFSSAANAILAPTNMDLWADEVYNASQQAGGVYENLPLVTTDNTTETPRNVFISREDSGELTRYSASNIQNLSIKGIDVNKQDTVRTLMLNYMGFNIDEYDKDSTDVTKLKGNAPKSMGGVYHSTPLALVAKASRKEKETEYSSYQKYVMFGAMDNALHIIDDDTGEEILSYFPQEVLANNGQYKAITQKLNAETGEAAPSFGVDAPWEAYATYELDSDDNNSIVAKELYAFGGARLGARAYYGIDLSGLDKVKSARSLNGFKPSQLFTITPEREDYSKAYFERMGYTWAKPVITHINWKGKRTLVAILSGGYDPAEYDRSDAERLKANDFNDATLGNAVYVVDAKTGVPLIVAGHDGSYLSTSAGFTALGTKDVLTVTNPNLKFSVPGAVKVLDRDADELADHLYFADLNGQLFRLDIDNVVENPRARLVRLADLGGDSTKPGPRFYEVPTVTIQNEGGRRFATVSVASGDRSNPLRITDPDEDTAGLTVTYTANNGSTVTLKANKAKSGGWVKSSGFPTDNSISLSSEGTISIPANVRKSGTSVIATTMFKSTESISATAVEGMNEGKSVNSDPLAPTVSLSSGAANITIAKTSDLDEAVTKPNSVYTLYDKDVASVGVFSTKTTDLLTKDVQYSNDSFPDITVDSSKSSYAKKGWRAPIKAWGINNGTPQTNNAIKAMGPLSAIDNKLYVSAYNPVDGKSDFSGCVAQVVGSTEVYQFCLPFGICKATETGSASGSYQRIDYGRGLLPLSWVSDEDGLDRKLLTQTESATGGPAGLEQAPGSNAPSFADTFNIKGILKPTRWFDYGMHTPKKSTGSATYTEE